jgi:phosphate transport system protein
MALYEERLTRDTNRIREHVAALGSMVIEALDNSVRALQTGNHMLANNTVLGDQPINRQVTEINRLCHAFLALHLPSAGHLRTVSSILKVNNELERIGDYAATIGREAIQISKPPEETLKAELVTMSETAREMLVKALAAFNEDDAELARATMSIADRVGRERDHIFFELVSRGVKDVREMRDMFVLFVVFNMLDRVGGRAQNICEETLFIVTGETPARKSYNILFLDENNNCQSRIAEAVAARTFGNGGLISSAGRNASHELHPGLESFLETHGLDAPSTLPAAIDASNPDEIGSYDIVVSLQGPVRSFIPDQPFHTVFLDWDVGNAPSGMEKQELVAHYYDMYREIAVQLRDLHDTLFGEEAS